MLSRSAQVARQLLGDNYGGIVVSDRYSAYSWLPLEQRQLCWAHIKRDLTAIAERSGVSAPVGRDLLELENQLFHQWHRWRDGEIDRQELQSLTAPIRQAFESKLQEASDLGFHKGGENSPGHHGAHLPADPQPGASPMDLPEAPRCGDDDHNAAERALRPAVIHQNSVTAVNLSGVAFAKVVY